MISLRNVEKVYEHGPVKTWVLRRVNMDIREGEFVSDHGAVRCREIDSSPRARHA